MIESQAVAGFSEAMMPNFIETCSTRGPLRDGGALSTQSGPRAGSMGQRANGKEQGAEGCGWSEDRHLSRSFKLLLHKAGALQWATGPRYGRTGRFHGRASGAPQFWIGEMKLGVLVFDALPRKGIANALAV